jgi:uncharacterized protein
VVSLTADSNIWISAFNFPGKPRRLIEMADAGSIRIDISDAIIDEVLRVLRLKFRWPDESLAEARSQMSEIGHRVTPGQRVSAIEADETDNRILECAEAAGSGYVITGDKHLLQLGNFESIAIITVAAFLDKDGGQVASP